VRIVREYWEKVADCEKLAALANDPALKALHLDLANSLRLRAIDRIRRIANGDMTDENAA